MLGVLQGQPMPSVINETLLVLTPKIPSPERINQICPISLCNVLYKVITKSLVNRLKIVLPNLIGPEQCNFVPWKQIIDNIVLFQEALCSIRQSKSKMLYGFEDQSGTSI